jgi:hypothetical protein
MFWRYWLLDRVLRSIISRAQCKQLILMAKNGGSIRHVATGWLHTTVRVLKRPV